MKTKNTACKDCKLNGPESCEIDYKQIPNSKEAISNVIKNNGIVCHYVFDKYDPHREAYKVYK